MQMLLVLFAQSCNLQFYICNGLVKRCEKMTACPKRKQEGEGGDNGKTCKTWSSKITQLGMRKRFIKKQQRINKPSLFIDCYRFNVDRGCSECNRIPWQM